VRDKLGAVVAPADVASVPDRVRALAADPAAFRTHVAALRAGWVFNLGRSGIAGAEAIAGIARAAEAGHGRR
jgi:hypothetical protein